MSVKTILSVLLVASLAGNASFLIATFSKRPNHHAGAINQLALTAEQTAQLANSKQVFLDQRTQAQRQLAELRGALADEFTKDAPDRQRLAATTSQMAEIQNGMRPKVIEHLLRLHSLLTPTQRQGFASVMRKGGGAASVCPGAMLYSTPEER
jgi:Spy/CpxP family protein refolding chaperone